MFSAAGRVFIDPRALRPDRSRPTLEIIAHSAAFGKLKTKVENAVHFLRRIFYLHIAARYAIIFSLRKAG